VLHTDSMSSHTFYRHVVHVISMRAKKHMRRVHTSLIVPARAVMAYAHSIRDGTIDQFPCNTMGAPWNLMDRNTSVTVARQGSNPQPTAFCLVDLGPKTFDPTLLRRERCRVDSRASAAATSCDLIRSRLRKGKEFDSALFTDTGYGTLVGHWKASLSGVVPQAVLAVLWLFACLNYTIDKQPFLVIGMP
jgi:hypothetical protein